MAGESPDRSKQRESSAEATSGNADSVPEARDPRLAVARDSGGSAGAGQKDSSNGGADTATKVLRTPAVEEDTALRHAVSAWVRDADEPTGPTDAAETPAEGSERAAEGAQGVAEGSERAGSASAKTDGGAAEADAGAAKTEAASAGTDAEAEKTNAGPRDAGSASAGAGAEAEKTNTGTRKAETASMETDAEAEKTNAGTRKAETASTGAGAEAEKTNTGTPETGSASTGTDAGPDKTNTGTRETGSASTKTDAEATEDDADAKGAAGAGAAGGADAGGKAGSTAVADEEAEPEASTTAADDAAAKSGPDAEAPADAPRAAAGAGAETKGGAEAEDGTRARPADGEAEVETAGTPDEAETEGTPDEAADADGGADPRGPRGDAPASRAGGAGGKTAGGEAEAAADGVDQPTTVFKAVRPKAPDVDQPTTMLKVGPPAAKREESDPERTSKFVALKDDVRQKPKPKAAPADETAAVPRLGPERTTQQPLPPKPPLDLLAELTNTPPPPETPVRTLLRRVKIWTPLVILLVIIFAVVQTLRPLPSPTLALTAKSTYTFGGGRVNLPWPNEGQGWMDGDGIGTMGNFGKQTPVAIGSVAKTMTAYIILRDHPLKPGQEGPKIKVDATAEKEGGYSKSGESTLDTVHAGDSLTEKQALSAVMIPSANNIARLLARWDAGSEAAFVRKMNATAKQLGMTGTTYTDPSGLKETTVSTAQDQVKLGRAVVKVPALVAITSAASWTDPTGHNWPNYNSLPYWIGAIGIKTGTTTAAGGNLLFAARKKVGGQTVTVVGAILGQHKGPSILDTANNVSKTALLGAEQALTSAKILKKGDVVGYVDDQLGGHTPVVVTRDVTAVGWSGLKVELSFTSGTVPHTAKAGTEVGTLTVGDGTTAGVKVPVALQQDLAEPGFGAKLTRLG
ncbi:D-alanyl-D-alanine carboxypeptidase [Streptomyces sp. MB22_4]|uniref:D-alanyl-D-alanine carboxypeptidase n=1 Tax=Streptomyces sp. MB22_4 TaxID=3383120 RepID=UPI0039A200B6